MTSAGPRARRWPSGISARQRYCSNPVNAAGGTRGSGALCVTDGRPAIAFRPSATVGRVRTARDTADSAAATEADTPHRLRLGDRGRGGQGNDQWSYWVDQGDRVDTVVVATTPEEAAMSTAQDQGQGHWLGGLREGYAEVGDVRLHYVEAARGRWSCCCTASP